MAISKAVIPPVASKLAAIVHPISKSFHTRNQPSNLQYYPIDLAGISKEAPGPQHSNKINSRIRISTTLTSSVITLISHLILEAKQRALPLGRRRRCAGWAAAGSRRSGCRRTPPQPGTSAPEGSVRRPSPPPPLPPLRSPQWRRPAGRRTAGAWPAGWSLEGGGVTGALGGGGGGGVAGAHGDCGMCGTHESRRGFWEGSASQR